MIERLNAEYREVPLVSVLIPVYNEVSTVTIVLTRVLALTIPLEIVVVDDGSTDGTGEALQRFLSTKPPSMAEQVKVISHPQNQGKGAALRSAIATMTGSIAVIQDADLEYNPAEIPRLIQPIIDGLADVVYGSRFTGSPRSVLFFWHTAGNKFLTLLSNMCTNLNLTDMETGYKAFRSEILRSFPIRSQRFGVEPEITAKVSQLRCRMFEVPISYSGRTYSEGKKAGWRDGFSALATIARFRISRDLNVESPGQRTLRRIQRLRAYSKLQFDLLHPWIEGELLEIGAGLGTLTAHLAPHAKVLATDLDSQYLKGLSHTFAEHPNVTVQELDLTDQQAFLAIEKRFQTVVCSNVLEHVENDSAALQNIYSVLAASGRLVLIVPAHPILYGQIDRSINHFRRYGRRDIVEKLTAAGFSVEHVRHVNALGVPGWYINSVLLKRSSVPGVQAKINDLLTPFVRFEQRFNLPIGISLLVVAKRETV